MKYSKWSFVALLIVGGLASAILTWGLLTYAGVRQLFLNSKGQDHIAWAETLFGGLMLIPVACSLMFYWGKGEEDEPLIAKGGEVGTYDSAIKARLYMGQFLSSFGDRMWQMAIPMIFMECFQTTLMPSAIFGLSVYLGCILLMAKAGAWVDRAPRFKVFSTALAIENLLVVVTCILVIFLAHAQQNVLKVDAASGKPAEAVHFISGWPLVLFVCICILSMIGEVLNQTQTIAIQRDWIVVISHRDEKVLTSLNTTMKRIDLSCKVLGPFVIGLVLQFSHGSMAHRVTVGAGFVALWNMFSFPLEYLLTYEVYINVPELAVKEFETYDTDDRPSEMHAPHVSVTPPSTSGNNTRILDSELNDGSDSDGQEDEGMHLGRSETYETTDCYYQPSDSALSDTDSHQNNKNLPPLPYKMRKRQVSIPMEASSKASPTPEDQAELSYLQSWRAYVRHPMFQVSFAYSLLFMTVLDNGALMTGYLQYQHIPDSIIGMQRGAGAIVGLVGTIAFPLLRQWTRSTEMTGLIAIWFFWLCLVPTSLAFMNHGKYADYVLIGCMVVSRVGLWSFDLAEVQLLQMHVKSQERGLFNSMQTAATQVACACIQLLGMMFWDPRKFADLVQFSILTVGAAAVVYSSWYSCYYSDPTLHMMMPHQRSPAKQEP